MKKILLITLSTVAFVALAGYLERGYFAIGAELPIVMFLPTILWVYKKEFKEEKGEGMC